MAKKYTLDGEVGWEINTRVVKGILHDAGGEDITVDFSSPGGSVYTGIKVFNMFKNYSGKVTFNIIGLAASMGSYIPLSGDVVTAEPNAVFMIHNVWTYASGDHKELRKTADVIEGLSRMLSKEYTRRTGKDAETIAKMMDDDTYLFGSEILDAGFVDSINGDGGSDPDAKTINIGAAKESFNACMNKLRDEQPDDYDQIAALLPECKAGSLLTDKTPVDDGRDNLNTEDVKIMDVEKLKKEFPEVAAALVKEGVLKERDRVNAHLILGKQSGDTETAFQAIEDGSEMTATINAKYMAASMRNRTLENRVADDDDAAPADAVQITRDAGTQADEVAAAVEKNLGIIPEK